MVVVPDAVRRKAVLAGAQGWLDDLPLVLADLADGWGLETGEVFGGGTEALVVAATRRDGTPAVLKLLVPRDGPLARAAHDEITVLRLADGQGVARLLEADADRGAVLLERLGPSMHDLGLPLHERRLALTACAQRLWRPASGYGLTTGAEKARWLVDFVTRTWEELDRPCTEAAVAHALASATARERAHDDERSVLVHGDVHEWNALQAPDGGWRLVDPDGLLAEAEYDLGVVLREDPLDLDPSDPGAPVRELAALTGLDPRAVWEWSVVERVSTGLVCASIGLEVGRDLLAAADLVAGRREP